MWHFFVVFLIAFFPQVKNVEIDTNGYVIFCPCMGRFGNQVDQLIGVLEFSKSLNRTLVLPNFIEFEHPKTKMVSFETIFQVATVAKFTKVVTMTDFTRKVMNQIWPKDERYAFCWTPRQAIYDKTAAPGCHAKEGSPFGPFWDHIGVSFVGDEYFGDIPGGYDTYTLGSKTKWSEKFNHVEFPVLAFSSAPAGFPSKARVWSNQKYLKWSSRITENAKKFISSTLTKPFVGVHLRNNDDWSRVCDHIDSEKNMPLFASEQCLGEAHYRGTITKEICGPNVEQVVAKIVEEVANIGAKSVFVASDKNHYIEEINEALKPYDVKAYRQTPDDMYTSLAILGRSDMFIGSCVSTFSHIVKRERDHGCYQSKPSTFFGIHPEIRRMEL